MNDLPAIFLKAVKLPGIIYRVIDHIAVQKKFLRQNTDPILATAFQKNDGSLGQDDRNKIDHYYGLAVPAILGEAFCALRGKEMSVNERWASTGQGAMTGLFDDFFDKDYMDDDSVEKMLHPGGVTPAGRSNQQLFDLFYKKALENTSDRKAMQDALTEVYQAQVASKKQKDDSITANLLLDITFFKGGSSLVFYRTAFSPGASAEEINLLYKLGGLMQFSNDIFDVYKDREAGIKTLLTETESIESIRSLFKKLLHEYYQIAFEMGFPKKQVREFLDILSIGLFSRCFVCLDQLEKNERSSGNQFRVNEYTRQQLICDMDKKINMLRSAWAHLVDIP